METPYTDDQKITYPNFVTVLKKQFSKNELKNTDYDSIIKETFVTALILQFINLDAF